MSSLIEDIERELDSIVDAELLSYYSSAHNEMRNNIKERVYGDFAHWLVEMYEDRDNDRERDL